MGLGEGPGFLTVDSDLVVGLSLLSFPGHCSALESPLILDPDGRQEEGAIGEDLSHTIPWFPPGRQDLPSFCSACVLGREAGPKQCRLFGEGLLGQRGGAQGQGQEPTYQFPFQLLGRFPGSTLTVQHQWLPNPDCEVLTTYHCPWETAPRWRGQKGDRAERTSTGWAGELEQQCPGFRKVLGRGQCLPQVGGSGSPHRLRTSTQAPAVPLAAILPPVQAPGSACLSLMWPQP